jgi:hypothetical protein
MTISDRCLERAQECETAAKSHVCRSNAELRAALDKAAAVYRMVAGWAYEGASMAHLAARCRARAAEYMESAKPYKGPARTAYIKGAATLREVAEWADSACRIDTIERLHETIHAQALAQGTGTPEADGQAMETAEGADPAEGQVPVPVLPARRPRARGYGSRSQDPAVQGRDGQTGEPGLDVP